MKMNSSISAMTDVNCGISGQRAKSRMDIHRSLRYMAAQTAADVNTKPAVCSYFFQNTPESILMFFKDRDQGIIIGAVAAYISMYDKIILYRDLKALTVRSACDLLSYA